MKLTIESTTRIIEINGLPARVWEGKTESGIPVICFPLPRPIRAPSATKAPDVEEDPVFNRFAVGLGFGGVVILAPRRGPMTELEALNLAAWLVAMSGKREEFNALLEKVLAT